MGNESFSRIDEPPGRSLCHGCRHYEPFIRLNLETGEKRLRHVCYSPLPCRPGDHVRWCLGHMFARAQSVLSGFALPNWRRDLLVIVLGIVMGVGLVGTVNQYLHPAPAVAPPVAVAVAAKPAPQVEKAPTETLPARPVKVYRAAVKGNLKLPASIIEDRTKHVTASARVDADDRPQTVTTVYDEMTGESTSYVKAEPLPWMALDRHGEIGMYTGIKNGAATVRLQARQGLFQVKAVHVGAVASLDQPMNGPMAADYFVGVGLWYRW